MTSSTSSAASSRAGRPPMTCTNTTRRATGGTARRPAHTARRAGGCCARWQIHAVGGGGWRGGNTQSRFGREPALAFRLRSCTQGAIKRVEAREADWAAGICVSQCGPDPIEIGTLISRNSPISAAKTHGAALSGAPIWGCQSRS
jgi:hypothetical protein